MDQTIAAYRVESIKDLLTPLVRYSDFLNHRNNIILLCYWALEYCFYNRNALIPKELEYQLNHHQLHTKLDAIECYFDNVLSEWYDFPESVLAIDCRSDSLYFGLTDEGDGMMKYITYSPKPVNVLSDVLINYNCQTDSLWQLSQIAVDRYLNEASLLQHAISLYRNETQFEPMSVAYDSRIVTQDSIDQHTLIALDDERMLFESIDEIITDISRHKLNNTTPDRVGCLVKSFDFCYGKRMIDVNLNLYLR